VIGAEMRASSLPQEVRNRRKIAVPAEKRLTIVRPRMAYWSSADWNAIYRVIDRLRRQQRRERLTIARIRRI
jgi:hypothetical protein